MFVYSNCIGTFLFSDDLEIKESVFFGDVIEANRKLASGEWLDEELALLKKIRDRKALFLGFKNKKPENVSFTSDVKKLARANQKLLKHEAKIRETALKIARLGIKESVKPDELIAQASNSIQELDRTVSRLSKRLREWYGLKNPELAAGIEDNFRFVREMLEDKKTSEMGAELAAADVDEMKELAGEIERLLKLRARQENYMEKRIKESCSNIAAVAGASIGAKLIASAGSLRNLAFMPATKLQILGAERSMFNFLRKKTKKMPRFGILHEHKFIASAEESRKGKAARLLADKISIAARIDYFKGEFAGDKLLEDVIKKLE